MASPSSRCFRICLPDDWNTQLSTGRYCGTDFDRCSGFIHLSTLNQLSGTAAGFFAARDIIVVELSLKAMEGHVRWEAADGRDEGLFPHYYDGSIDLRDALVNTSSVAWDVSHNAHTWPMGLRA
eukprot:gnl/Spiro4/25356_TR12634_c0_g1_i1.p1 gnl/Spiro4/25356_TR12634_c0_g1~~gnl/Spiro4/25356_TR12634_c0_g1_i1.p1  ORF type:complete len:124 (+),score=17.69 gnl/Spiro4/25356_TR12634_c0_g1_i1:76-447(+)